MIDSVTFSIIIPSYNRRELIGNTIESILSQSFQSIQIIIVDDGSSDNTDQIVNSINDTRIQYYKIQNSERGAARNYGLNYATGKYINYFDSDDLFLPCLARVAEFIIASNSPDVLYGEIQHVDENGALIKSDTLPYKSFTKNLLYNNFLACGSVFMKREIAEKFFFHEDRRLSSAEDWELWLRVHAQFMFQRFPGSIFQQVHHSGRSLMTISSEKVEVRDSYFAKLVTGNENMKKFYGTSVINLFVADRYTFIALAWSAKNTGRAFQYLIKSLGASLFVLTRKRFWAVLKNSFINLLTNDKRSS
jgi:glycosyltransferase involved in cell wall biosynthesis